MPNNVFALRVMTTYLSQYTRFACLLACSCDQPRQKTPKERIDWMNEWLAFLQISLIPLQCYVVWELRMQERHRQTCYIYFVAGSSLVNKPLPCLPVQPVSVSRWSLQLTNHKIPSIKCRCTAAEGRKRVKGSTLNIWTCKWEPLLHPTKRRTYCTIPLILGAVMLSPPPQNSQRVPQRCIQTPYQFVVSKLKYTSLTLGAPRPLCTSTSSCVVNIEPWFLRGKDGGGAEGPLTHTTHSLGAKYPILSGKKICDD